MLATAIICHERRYPELVRLAVMGGAQVVFHPNAGMDTPEVSRAKRAGEMGCRSGRSRTLSTTCSPTRSAPKGVAMVGGDSKIVAPDGSFLQLADNRRETGYRR